MAYTIKYSNGKILALLADQSSDTISTSLTLVGKNSNAYGEAINNNFVHLLENFAKRTAPSSPITGQLWYDTTQGQLKVYSNNLWKPVGSPVIGASQPSTLISGEFWFDTQGQKLWYYNGTQLIDLAKPYNDFDGKNGPLLESVIENSTNAERPIINFYTNGVLFGWASDSDISLNISSNPLHISSTSTIRKGFTLASAVGGLRFNGTATSAESISGFSADQVFRKYDDPLTTGNDGEYTYGYVDIYNEEGLSIGPGGSVGTVLQILTTGTNAIFLNQEAGGNTVLQYTTQTGIVKTQKNAILINSVNNAIGFFTSTVGSNVVEFNSPVTIKGNLTVQGDTTYVDSNVLRVKDQQIELAQGNTSDSFANDGGILLHGSSDYKFVFQASNKAWMSTQDYDTYGYSNSYRIGGQQVLSLTELGPTVTKAYIANLENVESIIFGQPNENRLTITPGQIQTVSTLTFKPGSYADFNNSTIQNFTVPTTAADPTNQYGKNGHAVNKGYVDTAIYEATGGYGGRKPYTLSIDVTRFVNVNEEVKNYLDVLLPVDGGDVVYYAQPVGARCSVLCSTYTASTATFVLTLDKTLIPYEYTTSTYDVLTQTTSPFNTATTIISDVAGIVDVTGPLPQVSYVSKLYQVVKIDLNTPANLIKTYSSNNDVVLELLDTTNIRPGATLSGNGYTSGQIVVEVLGTQTIVTNYPPNGIPSPGGQITFTSTPGFTGWVYLKDL
jgi:hypothetical protein